MPRLPSALEAQVSDDGIPDAYSERESIRDRADFSKALSDAVVQVDENLSEFYDRYPADSSTDLNYSSTINTGWTPSFWTGLCWLTYEAVGKKRYRDAAETQVESFRRRLDAAENPNHDLGFLYTLSAVAGYKLTREEDYRELALQAAEMLMDRFWEAPGLIQAWGNLQDEEDVWNQGRMIIDTMMNIPLLFWATETSGEKRYATIAETHARTTAEHLVRSDGSTYHTFKCDIETGDPVGGETFQGHSDSSTWSRGQAWAIYGYALVAEYTGNPAYAELSAKLANYYLNRVEKDGIPKWDFDAPANNILDTSAASVAACGLIQLASTLPAQDERIPAYRTAALETLHSLVRDYTTVGLDSNGLLTDATQHRPKDKYGECCIWGDYFYFEALIRTTKCWETYW